MEELDSIDLRSKAFQEVIGEPPSWLMRWGMTAIALALIALLLVGYFFKYPETVTAAVSLETANPPIELIAPTLGILSPLFSENSTVEANKIVARLENLHSGNHQQIADLDTMLQLFDKKYLRAPDFTTMNNWDLGAVKGDYLKFYQAFNGEGSSLTLQQQTIKNFNETIRIFKEDILDLRALIAERQAKLDKIPEEIKLLQEAYSKSKSLNDRLIIEEKNTERNTLNGEIQGYKQQINDIKRSITNQENQKSLFIEQVAGKRLTRQQSINYAASNLRSSIDEWKHNHIIEAPIAGTLVYQNQLKGSTDNITVDKGQKIFAIIPTNAQDSIAGKMYLTSEESIKVKVGQVVKIKIDAFNPSEYGLLEGVVVDKATLPINGQYLVRINLPNNMETTKNKTLPFEHQMQGEAKIITKDRRILGLIFDQFIEMLNR